MPSISQLVAIKALDGLHIRATVTAENVANANSVSYRMKSVPFEQALRLAAENGLDSLSIFEPQVQINPRAISGDDIRIDLEMASASATAVRYAAIADVINRQFQIARLAIRGGQ